MLHFELETAYKLLKWAVQGKNVFPPVLVGIFVFDEMENIIRCYKVLQYIATILCVMSTFGFMLWNLQFYK
ncbi:hypothetical protein KL86DPRO_60142 [uncultured delta proteobacterium]|uniref:Uncharacterized protein n=1 Tax=uncultured delta proteobacterium TaxID=34034 RepID=A0A212KFG6_9DELT|nr:hypothetical protein KL86DPRO_60142 [uncultured delta proteobacterium]